MDGKLIYDNFLYSGFKRTDFDEKYVRSLANINFGLLLAVIFGPVIGLIHLNEQFGFNSPIHGINCFIFSAVQLLLLLYLRRSVNNLRIVSYLLIVSLFLIFSSSLIFSINEDTRLIWFFILFFAVDILIGVKARNAIIISTLLLFVIYFCWPGVNTNLSYTEIISSLLFIFIIVVLFQFYDRKSKESVLNLSIANTALKESEEKYRLLFEMSEDPMWLIIDNQFVMANQAATKCLGYSSSEELTSIHPSGLSPENQSDGKLSHDKANEMMATAHNKGFHRFEWDYKRKNGEVFPVEVSLTRIPYQQHEALFCVWRDITDRKQAEDKRVKLELQLQQSHKMEAIGLMAGGVAHDLNNILSGIISYPELLLLKFSENSELKEPLMAIQESGNRAAAVVDDLLTVARGVARVREPHDINLLVQEYLNSPECKKLKELYPNVTYQHQLEAFHAYFVCSPVHIKKSLMNLVINAAESIVGEGTVFTSTYNQSIDDDIATEYGIQPGEYVVLSIQDTGFGISDEYLQHIFEPFYSKKMMGRSGTGLGLAVVWNTMEDHAGKVLVESNDKGTCFKLYFPLSEEGATKAESATTEKLTGNNEHILIVDDEPQLRDIACQMLQSLGYSVNSVSSGELALQFVKEKPVDLLVIDMLMEPGMNGRQTYTEILKMYPDHKAVIASGFSESDDVKATIQLGADSIIKKPYSMDQLGQAVKTALSS